MSLTLADLWKCHACGRRPVDKACPCGNAVCAIHDGRARNEKTGAIEVQCLACRFGNAEKGKR